jgi:hypothetical protein
MAGALKQEFIEAVRLLPDGIQEFLDAPLPEPPTISTPADVDAGIIASGVLSKYLLDVFAPFAGLTPVELLTRIGQHNSVLESAMLAGLEYIEGADPGESNLTIVEPQDGISYTPGEMRFTATVQNGMCVFMTLNLGGNDTKMIDKNGTWTQYINMSVGDYTATFTATFEDNTTQSANANFTIAEYDPENPPDPPPDEPPSPPGGKDDQALERAREIVKKTYTELIKIMSAAMNATDFAGFLLYAQIASVETAFKNAVNSFLQICPDTSFTIPLKAEILALWPPRINIDPNPASTMNRYSEIMNRVNTLFVGLRNG